MSFPITDFVNFLETATSHEDEDSSKNEFPLTSSPYYDDISFASALNLAGTNISILSCNICSLSAKFNEFTTYLDYLSRQNALPSVICLQEAFITNNSDLSMLIPPGYYVFSCGKSASGNGGLITYIRLGITAERLEVSHDNSVWEGLFIKVRTNVKHRDVTVVNIYRPPRTNVKLLRDFYANFTETMLDLQQRGKEIIAVGDFNIDLLRIHTKPIHEEFFETICSLNLLPKITQPTRMTCSSASLIDNIFCTVSDYFQSINAGILNHRFSDHQPVFAILTVPFATPPSNRIDIRSINDESMEKFKKDLQENPIILDGDNPSYMDFHSQFQEKFSEHFPVISKKITKYNKSRNKWMNMSILNLLKKRDKLFFRLRKLSKSGEKYIILNTQLKNQNKVLKKLITAAKRTYFRNQFNLFKNNIKKTWNLINETIGKRRGDSFPDSLRVGEQVVRGLGNVATHFNEFFANAGHKIAEGVGRSEVDPCSPTKFHPVETKYTKSQSIRSESAHAIIFNSNRNVTFHFKTVSEESVRKAINNLHSKSSTGFDGISTKLLKYLKDELIGNLTELINTSITRSEFPDLLKIAKVIPLHKKGDKTSMNNYRPVSLLSAFSKVYERIIHEQLYQYFESNNIFNEFQYGYRKNRSTELASSELIDIITGNKQKGRKTVGIFLDLSKAFDSLNHTILLKKLALYGLSDSGISLMESYLSNRYQYVELNGNCSPHNLLSVGVPQGSILGPLLFIIYLNDLVTSSKFFKYISYADDTTLVYSVPHKQSTHEANIILNRELDVISEWFRSNKLQLNTSKTNLMVFRGKRSKNFLLNISINGEKIQEVSSFKFLGLHLNYDLKWKTHVRQITAKISRGIGIMNRLRNIYPKEILMTLYHTLVTCHLNFQILNWGYEHDAIFKVQKKAIRAASNANYVAHTSPLFRSAGVLRVDDMYRMAQIKFYYKFINKSLPNHFLNLNIKTNHMLQTIKRTTRNCDDLATPSGDSNSLEFRICKFIKSLPIELKNELSRKSDISRKYKKLSLSGYENTCNRQNCFSCNYDRFKTRVQI